VPSKFQNKYRISSARLQDWDYSNNGAYFITICTQNKEHFFGKIIKEEMILNKIGILAEHYWIEIPNHFPFIELANFVIMPNHIHGILIINNPSVETLHCNVSNHNVSNDNVSNNNVSKNDIHTISKNQQMSLQSPRPGSVSAIIRSYKSIVSRKAKEINPNFRWQSRFYDHIIRNSNSFENIQNYIQNNPEKWKTDEFY